MLTGKTIVVGVCGGIADYKAVDVVSKLRKQNADVYVVMTKSACQFVTPLTFQATSKNMVMTSETDELSPLLLEVLQRADCLLIVPASSNIIGKTAYGISDSVLSKAVPQASCPVVFVPNHSVYTNTIAKANVKTLLGKGYHVIDPGEDGSVGGKGKIAHVDDILDYVINLLGYEKDMEGQTVLIIAGSARENMDPLVCMTNYSTGKMGQAIAKEAMHRGAAVTLITARNMMAELRGVNSVLVDSAPEMYQATMNAAKDMSIVIKSATVEDFRPAIANRKRIEKETGKILSDLSKQENAQVLAGFCMAMENVEGEAVKKMKEEGLDLIVACDVSPDREDGENSVVLITPNGDRNEITSLERAAQANSILSVALAAAKEKVE